MFLLDPATAIATSTARSFLRLVCAALLFFVLPAVHAEIKGVHGRLRPVRFPLHFYDSYIRGPGSIDLSNLLFIARDDSPNNQNSKNKKQKIIPHPTPEDESSSENAATADAARVDVLVFPQPDECATQACRLMDLGVGAWMEDQRPPVAFCCTEIAIERGYCTQTDRLIVNETLFTGNRISAIVTKGKNATPLNPSEAVIPELESGYYAVLMANCEPTAPTVQVQGILVWKSKHGYLPAELFGLYVCFFFLFFVHVGLFLWYGGKYGYYACCSANTSSGQRLPLEKYIGITILLGVLETFFQLSDFIIWNRTGEGHPGWSDLAILMGCLKEGVALMTAAFVMMGWGVVRDATTSSWCCIVTIGGIYTSITLVQMWVSETVYQKGWADRWDEDNNTFYSRLDDVLWTLRILMSLGLFGWMWCSLRGALATLQQANQIRKLEKYAQVRTVFVVITFLSLVWAVVAGMHTLGRTGQLLREREWILDALGQTIFFAALLAVAIVWKPDPNSAAEYAYVLNQTDDDDDDENEIELSAPPSALDGEGNGYNGDTLDEYDLQLNTDAKLT